MDFSEIRDDDDEAVARERRPGCLRGLLGLLLVLLLPLLLLAALLPTLLSSDGGRRWALAKMNAAAAPASVTFDRWSLGWFTPVRLDALSVSDPARGAELRAEQVAFGRGVLGLLPVGALNLGRVTVKKPTLALTVPAAPEAEAPAEEGGKQAGKGGFVLPVADLAATLNVEGGEVTVSGDAAEPFAVRQVDGTVTLESFRKPIAVQAQARVGEGLVALEGRVLSLRDLLQGAESEQPEKLTLKLVALDLAEFRPLLQQLTGAPWIQSGVAEGALTVTLQGPGQFAAEGGVLVSRLSVAAPGQAPSPAGDLALMVDAAYDRSVVKIARFELNSPWAKAEASGTLQAGQKPGVLLGAINAKADADLAAVARDFAPALGLAKGFQVRQGRLRATLALEGGEEALAVDVAAAAEELALAVDGEPLALKPAPSLTFKARFPHGQWPEVEALRFKAPFADVYASGRFDAAAVKAKLDLTVFSRDFKRMLKQAPPMVGSLYLDVSTQRDGGRVAVKGLAKASDVAAELKPGQRTVLSHAALTFEGFVPLGAGLPQAEVQDAAFSLAVDRGKLSGGWKRFAPGREAGAAELRGFTFGCEMEVASLRSVAGGFLPAAAQRRLAEWQGFVIANATAEVAGGAVKARANAAGRALTAAAGEGGVWRVPDVRLEASVAREGASEATRVEAAVTGAAALARGGETVFAEPEARLRVEARVAPDGRSVSLPKVELASSLAELEAQAELSELATRVVLAAKGRSTVNFGALSELLEARGAGVFALSGKEARAFEFEAPLAGGATTVLTDGRFTGAAHLGSVKGLGLTAGAADVEIKLAKGGLKLSYAPELNGGKLRLVPEVDATGSAPVLFFPPQTKVLQDVALTQELVDGLLVHVNPLFQGSQAVGGTVSLDVRGCRVTAGVPPERGVEAELELLFSNLKLEPGPTLRELLSILKVRNAAYGVERLPVHVSIRQGRVQVEPVKMVFDGQPLTLSGWVAFDGALQYVVEVPLTDRLIGGTGAKLLKGAAVRIPVAGTVTRPVLDTAALKSAMAGLLKSAVSERAAEKVGTFLEKLQQELQNELRK